MNSYVLHSSIVKISFFVLIDYPLTIRVIRNIYTTQQKKVSSLHTYSQCRKLRCIILNVVILITI